MSEHDDPTPGPAQPLPAPPEPRMGLILEAAPRYVIGFPLFVSVLYDNRAASGGGGLPELVPWAVPDVRVGFRLVSTSGGPEIVHKAAPHERGSAGIGVEAGELRRGLVDLSNYAADLRPGHHRLSFLLVRWTTEHESPPVPVELVAPSAAEAQESARLRALTSDVRATDHGWWWPFLTRFWGTPVVSPTLGAEAEAQLGLLLFFHRAIFGPEAPGQLDPAWLGAVAGPHLQAEAQALRLELAAARNDPSTPSLRADLLSRHPGMDHRAAAIDAGEGFITHARKLFGAESVLASRFPKLPYTP